MNEVKVDICGTVVTDPVLRQTRAGDHFLSFRLACNERRWKAEENTWVDGQAQYFSVTAFRTLAGNAYHCLEKGQRVMVSGRLRLSRYEGKDGAPRTAVQIEAHEIGLSLKFGQASFTKCLQPQMPTNDRLGDDCVTEVMRSMEPLDDGDEAPAHQSPPTPTLAGSGSR